MIDAFTGRTWGLLIFLGIFAVDISYPLYFWALQHGTLTRGAIFIYLKPVVSTLPAFGLLDEPLNG